MNTRQFAPNGKKGGAAAHHSVEEPEQRWPAIAAVLCIGGLNVALPKSLIFVPDWLPHSLAFLPRWMPLIVVVILLIPTIITYRLGYTHLNHVFGHSIAVVVTFSLILSLGMLIKALPAHTEAPVALLKSAASLWVTNVLVFASWYWRLDAGGPHKREMVAGHDEGAFLFPQMTLQQGKDASNKDDEAPWSPKFVDYLFLAFNTSTALSPTDTAVLSRWAKVLVMVQASISLTIIVILAGRAVNIL